MSRYCPTCGTTYALETDVCPVDGIRLIDDIVEQMEGREIDGRYRVVRRIGEGGMGLVYLAEQILVGRQVALKVVRGAATHDRAAVTRFFQEARAIAALKNPHTVTLYDFGRTEEGLLYYAMELLEGESLAQRIARAGNLRQAEAAAILRQVVDSLTEAHDCGILHRDLKPGNVFLSERRGALHATVLDFGIAKLTMDDSAESVTDTGHICGTPAYISPELALGKKPSPASDLYSVGVILYEMLAGRPPFDDDTPVRLLMRHISEPPLPVNLTNPQAALSIAMEQFIRVALAKAPEDRFPSCEAFLVGLDAALAGTFRAELPEPAPAEFALPPDIWPRSEPHHTTTVAELPLHEPHPETFTSAATEVDLPSSRSRSSRRLQVLVGLAAVVVLVLLFWIRPWKSGTTAPSSAPAAAAYLPDVVAGPPSAPDAGRRQREGGASVGAGLRPDDVTGTADALASDMGRQTTPAVADVRPAAPDVAPVTRRVGGDASTSAPDVRQARDSLSDTSDEIREATASAAASPDITAPPSDVLQTSPRPTARRSIKRSRPPRSSPRTATPPTTLSPVSPTTPDAAKKLPAEPTSQAPGTSQAPPETVAEPAKAPAPGLDFKPIVGADDQEAGKGGLQFKEVP